MTNIIQGHFPLTQDKEAEKKDKPASIYQFHLHLTYSDPPIWRRFQVPGEFTLDTLDEVIRVIMGWSGEEAHKFYVGKIFFTMPGERHGSEEDNRFDESKYTLHDLEESMKWCFIYLYDAGDGMEHEIELEEILPASQGEKYPVLLAGERIAPPETVAGIHAYEQWVTEWQVKREGSELSAFGLDIDFDPDLIDIVAMNNDLKRIVQK